MEALISSFMSLTAPLGSRQSSTLQGHLMSIASAPVACSGHESSRWLLHAVYLTYANWGINFLCSGSREIEIFRDSATGFYSTAFGW